MFHQRSAWTRTAALAAIFAYALLPSVLLAQCGCGDCSCAMAEDGQACCCTQPAKGKSCCQPKAVACPSCGSAASGTATGFVSNCSCQPQFASQSPAQPTNRAESSEAHVHSAIPLADTLVYERPTSDAISTATVLDPAAHSPRLHLLNCVWRN